MTPVPSFLGRFRQVGPPPHLDLCPAQHPVSAWRHPFQRAPCNILFYWDATAGCVLHSAHTPSCPVSPPNRSSANFLSNPRTEGLPTFISDNRPTTDTFHLEFAGVHAISLLSTPSLVPVSLVRSSGVPALTGHYLIGILPRDGVSSETEVFVANGYQTIPLSESTDLEPGGLLGASPYASPMVAIPKKDGNVRITVNYKKPSAPWASSPSPASTRSLIP